MDGRSVFKWVIRTLSDSVTQVLDAANLTADKIDLTIFHQANIRIIDAAANDLGLPSDKGLRQSG